jgi:glutathione S-transferase
LRGGLWTSAGPGVTFRIATPRGKSLEAGAAARILPRSPASQEPRAVAQRITLYGPRTTPYTEKVRRALVLKGLDFALREPESPEDFKRWSPETGLLPVLTIDSELVSDSTRILFRLDELYPKPPLLSSDPVVAAQQRQLEDWADESFLWYWNRWSVLAQRRDGADDPDARHRPLRGVRRALAWLRAGGTWERPETALMRGVDDRLGDLVNLLGSRRFFYADQPSMADLAVYGMLFVLRTDLMTGSARLLANRATLIEFMRRLEESTGG